MTDLPTFRLDGRRALVTGAGRGIGRAIALGYAAAGAEVTLCARSQEELNALSEEIRASGGTCDVMPLDITDQAAVTAALADREAYHILLNNAGTNRPKPLTEVVDEDIDAVLDLNVRATILMTRAVVSRMLEDAVTGSVITMSSQMGHVGAANRTLYCASKWAVEGFTRALAVELGPQGIRVNTICPTFIETPLTAPFFEDPAFKEQVLSKIKLGRIGQPSDIVGAAVFLASDASALMTGSSVMLDGGWTAD
ncbi:short chain dehydrogenase [Pseudooceanicola batsensis HTCC2597]|uniref:Short chain dehydrogenase n=1 Tax=Pseudooceanicola batsensis (strain ATCC BAA-863 / DSM 15984 / KCTC 12145 / HTCC2597) TaxID=252305 RepID=A3U0A6_PSEBH|nr:SDR family NAD(P)-dependent oxidoreductase [Pseudooceanicola batsensis]EAQ02197.1 short chain dehydrogenase [Pseudooceanicola batsensis HTCC2597]